MKKLVAKFDKVIIKPIEYSQQSRGRIIIADTGKERPEVGEIVSIGPGVHSHLTGLFIPTVSKVGDIVVIPKFGVTTFDFEGEEYYITKEYEILANIENVENND